MNLLGHILADNPTEIILRTFDISEQKLLEWKSRVNAVMDLYFSDIKVASLLSDMDQINKK